MSEETAEVLTIKVDEEGVWIAALSGRFDLPKVLDFLMSKGVRKYNQGAVKEFVKQKSRTYWKIAPRNEAEEKYAQVVVHVAGDGMSASITIEPPFFTHPWPTPKDIEESLARRGVVFGLDEEVIEKLARLKIFNEAITVAQGIPVQNGENARIEFLVDPDRPLELDTEAQKIDYKEISAFVHVQEGQEVAVIHPPTAGETGRSVLGEEIKPIPGKDSVFPVESGLNVSEDGLHLIAALDGRLLRKNNRLSVLPELEVSGDVDFSTGNIDFPGCVKIKGVVRDGFKVVSVGDIEVRQMVEGAYIESGGNIFVAGGVRAMARGRLISAGDITASFVDQAYIRAQGSVIIKNSLLHSDVGANQSVRVMGDRKSQIAGGKVLAGLEVVCQILGSEMGTKTEVVVGISAERAERRRELQALISRYEKDIAEVDNNLTFLKNLDAKRALTEKGQKQKISVMKTKFQMQAALIAMTNELKELEESLELTKTKGVVRVQGVCYPGVSITIRGVVYKVKEAFKYASFTFDSGEIRLRAFDA
ncbi:MAG: FapA family protein [Synergistaceae bacterium]|nr:FapA family protein [Synergistaceae bacterium]